MDKTERNTERNIELKARIVEQIRQKQMLKVQEQQRLKDIKASTKDFIRRIDADINLLWLSYDEGMLQPELDDDLTTKILK